MHPFFWREAWRSLSAHRGVAMTAVFALAAALLLCGVFLLLSHSAQDALRSIGDRREMIIYLKDDLTDADVQALSDRIRQYYGEPTYVSRKQAWDEFREQIGDPELLSAVDQNPLPASLRVRLKPELLAYAQMAEAARQVAQFPQVEDVRYGADYVRRLDDLADSVTRGTVAAGAVVAFAVVVILFNTLRLTVLARRQQVEIMLRLGASDRFIATPFVIEAILVALAASGLALALLYGLQQAVASRIPGITFLPATWAGAFAGGAVLLAWVSSAAALSRILRTVAP
ncbi:MAG TPA: permease-like cell division protein FtsX [Candidatus Eisenbacteria bacterium]|nr:permease-like cell division protein FtsX [Candidatus Eisenbacteria bacterium]